MDTLLVVYCNGKRARVIRTLIRWNEPVYHCALCGKRIWVSE